MDISRHRQHSLTDEKVLEMYEYMLLARKIDERMWLLNRAGKIPFVVSCQGQEATQVGAALALNKEEDWLCPYYRDLGMVLVFGQSVKDQFLGCFARAEDPNSGGRQMPGHFGDKRYRILSGSSPVTTQILHAVGIAYAGKLAQKDVVVLASCGEGSSNQGDWHEACNFAGLHKLPVVFLVENNKYAISVPLSKQVAGEDISVRAKGYGFPGFKIDGNDPIEVFLTVKDAVERCRQGEGPTLIEAMSYRLHPHSSDDDDTTYRMRKEVDEARQNDPLITFKEYLLSVNVLTKEKDEKLQAKLQKEIDLATEYAENALNPEPKDVYSFVFAQ